MIRLDTSLLTWNELMKNALLLAALIPLGIQIALADEPAPAPVDAATAPPACKQPPLPSKVRRADDVSEFNAKVEAYQTCIKAYINEQNVLANQHVAAANKAVAEANAFVNAVNEALAAPK